MATTEKVCQLFWKQKPQLIKIQPGIQCETANTQEFYPTISTYLTKHSWIWVHTAPVCWPQPPFTAHLAAPSGEQIKGVSCSCHVAIYLWLSCTTCTRCTTIYFFGIDDILYETYTKSCILVYQQCISSWMTSSCWIKHWLGLNQPKDVTQLGESMTSKDAQTNIINMSATDVWDSLGFA